MIQCSITLSVTLYAMLSTPPHVRYVPASSVPPRVQAPTATQCQSLTRQRTHSRARDAYFKLRRAGCMGSKRSPMRLGARITATLPYCTLDLRIRRISWLWKCVRNRLKA